MPDEPKVTAIVRSMARPSLDATLASLAAQDYVPLEVLVVAACGAAHPPLPARCGPHSLRLLPGATRLPRAAAAYAGLAAATGDWITFLDDDDVFLAGHLAALMGARAQAPAARVVHSLIRATFADGRVEHVGQPHSLIQLYERNYIHLSAAVFARELVAAGCRFDESLDILEDWDFFIQLAQRTTFHFVPRASFEWHADAGDSGAGGGANHDAALFAACRDRIYAKWAPQRDALVERVAPLLQDAAACAQRGDRAGAEARCREALAASPNDPFALNVYAMVRRAGGDLAEARLAQELAVAVRPLDAGVVYNLAIVCHAQGDLAAARRCCERALVLAPDFAPARKLAAELPAAAA